LEFSDFNYIINNLLDKNNFCIYETDCIGNNIQSNDCSSPIVHEPIYIDGTATGIMAHNWTWAINQGICTGSGTVENPYIIENLKISGFNIGIGLEIKNSIAPFVIRNCTIYNSGGSTDGGGVTLENVSNAHIINNNCSNSLKSGIYLREHCDNNTIMWNVVQNNSDSGIYLEDYCDENEISRNTANENQYYGIIINAGIEDSCYNNSIFENTVKNNSYGIGLQAACHFTKIFKNLIEDNDDGGIYLMGSNLDYNEIFENVIKKNALGVEISKGCYKKRGKLGICYAVTFYARVVVSPSAENDIVYHEGECGSLSGIPYFV